MTDVEVLKLCIHRELLEDGKLCAGLECQQSRFTKEARWDKQRNVFVRKLDSGYEDMKFFPDVFHTKEAGFIPIAILDVSSDALLNALGVFGKNRQIALDEDRAIRTFGAKIGY